MKKLTKEQLFYLYVLEKNDENTILNNNKLNFSFNGKHNTLRNISSLFSYYNGNGNSQEISKQFLKNIHYFLKNNLIEKDKHNVFLLLTEYGKEVLKNQKIISIDDLDKYLFKNLFLKNDEKTQNIYRQILGTLTQRRHSTKRYLPFNFNVNTQLMELFTNGLISITYRSIFFEITDTENFLNNMNYHDIAKKYYYFPLVKAFNRQEEYFRITEKGLNFLK